MKKEEQRNHYLDIQKEMFELSVSKSAVYGDSYRESPMAKEGMGILSLFTEINAKFMRLMEAIKTLPPIGHPDRAKTLLLLRETFRDTANYGILSVMLIDDELTPEDHVEFDRKYNQSV